MYDQSTVRYFLWDCWEMATRTRSEGDTTVPACAAKGWEMLRALCLGHKRSYVLLLGLACLFAQFLDGRCYIVCG